MSVATSWISYLPGKTRKSDQNRVIKKRQRIAGVFIGVTRELLANDNS